MVSPMHSMLRTAYRRYDNNALMCAINDVVGSKRSICGAGKFYNIPFSTLQRKVAQVKAQMASDEVTQNPIIGGLYGDVLSDLSQAQTEDIPGNSFDFLEAEAAKYTDNEDLFPINL